MAIQITPEDLTSLAILSAAGFGALKMPGAGGSTAAILSGRGAVGSSGMAARRFEETEYPTHFTPGAYHVYDVMHVPGPANNNAQGMAYMPTIEKAGRMQSLEEHNDALLKYVKYARTPKEMHVALMRGAEEEKKLPQFWDESSDSNNDRAKFTVSSSAVSGIRLTPDARIEVRWGTSPKWYTFKEYPNTYEASLAAQKLLKADSIGRAVMPFQRNGKPLKFKKGGDYSWWNRPNYDGAMV